MYHQKLRSQLKKYNLDTTNPPTPHSWQQFLQEINQAYAQADQDSAIFGQSLALSSQEMQELYEDLQRKTSHQLKTERDKLQSLLNHLPDGVVVFSEEGMITSLNTMAEALFGFTEAELKGHPITTILSFPTGQFDIDGIKS
ncbi:MAG: PAS domain S-box protein, partial [Anaerolineae bacterium]